MDIQVTFPTASVDDLRELATTIRVTVLRTIHGAGLGHVGGDLSVADVLATLYGSVLRIDPMRPDWPDRDRFIMSKGHAAVSLYTTLALRGFFDVAELSSFAQPMSRLNGHPNRVKVPGVETNTGPLGHGLPVAVGCAVGAQIAGSERRTYVVVGDGELQEGSNWEAAMYAGHRALSNLTLIVDRNGLQQGARTEDTNALDSLTEKFASFGWEAIDVDGHDIAALLNAFGRRTQKPKALIARTTKGKGVSFMEDGAAWHHKVPTAEQVEAGILELTS